MKKQNPKVALQIRDFSFELKKEIERICVIEDKSQGEVVEQAISEFIKRYHQPKKSPDQFNSEDFSTAGLD